MSSPSANPIMFEDATGNKWYVYYNTAGANEKPEIGNAVYSSDLKPETIVMLNTLFKSTIGQNTHALHGVTAITTKGFWKDDKLTEFNDQNNDHRTSVETIPNPIREKIINAVKVNTQYITHKFVMETIFNHLASDQDGVVVQGLARVVNRRGKQKIRKSCAIPRAPLEEQLRKARQDLARCSSWSEDLVQEVEVSFFNGVLSKKPSNLQLNEEAIRNNQIYQKNLLEYFISEIQLCNMVPVN